jgi:ABC-type dipeptide/oligopeptide/nickel transport system permease subunit/ABC-type transport system substrate-binding protein
MTAPGGRETLRAAAGRRGARRLFADRSARLGAALVVALALFAAVGPLAVGHDPNASDFSLSRDHAGAPPGPSIAHWLGTDPLFRDVLARLAAGARLSLAIAVTATLVSAVVGAAVGVSAGLTAGTRARAVDVVLMRTVDVVLALPFLLFVTAIGAAVGRSDATTILLVLGLSGWTGAARLVRAKTMQVRELDFVTASRALGAGPLWLVRKHVLPNVMGPIVVLATTSVGQMILAEAVLGYLTVGVAPPDATWGRMLHEAEPYLMQRLTLIAAPGFAILLAVLAFHRLGEGLRVALDPDDRAAPARGRVPLDLALAGAILALVALARPGDVRPPLALEAPSASPQRGGVLRVATYVGLRTLDPALAYDETATAIDELVFARLVAFDREGRVAPQLASAFTASPDGRTFTFTLRRGVRFHDGAELVAADVKRSLERTLHPSTPSPASSLYSMIAGFSAFHAGRAEHLDGVRVVADDVVAVDLDAPDATFLPVMTLAFAAPVCPSSGARVDAASPPLPCGTGPFRLAEWDPDRGVRLARHDGYYTPGLPYLDAIEWQTGVRTTTQRYKFEDGELDYLRDMSAADSALYRSSPAWAPFGRWSARLATNAVFLNTEVPPFDDVAMRRAVAFALDPSVLEKVRPEVEAQDRVLPASLPGPARDEPMRRHDPAAALAELAKAGYAFDPASGRGGYPREIEYLAVGDSFDQQAGEIFQQQLARVGIRVRLRVVTYATYLAEVSRRRTAAMGAVGWNADFPDPSNFFEPTLSSSAIQDEGSQNAAFFASPALDALLQRAHEEQDRGARFALYAEAERVVRDLAPWVPTYSPRVYEVFQPYVRGYEPEPLRPQRFAEVWLDERGRALARARGPATDPLAFVPFGLARSAR